MCHKCAIDAFWGPDGGNLLTVNYKKTIKNVIQAYK